MSGRSDDPETEAALAYPKRQLSIMLDGSAVMRAGGTGISTYARTLARALGALGHDVGWLAGTPAPTRADALVDAAMIADAPQAGGGLRRYAQTAGNMLGGLLAGRVAPREVAGGTVIEDPAGALAGRRFLAPHLFMHAHYRHMLRHSFTPVAAPSGVDVLHLTSPLPLKMDGGRNVVTIHDLVPLRLPYTTPDNKSEFARRVRQAVKQSDLVITVSETSKRDLVELLGADPAKIAVTFQPSDLEPLSEAEQAGAPGLLNRYGLQPGRYALWVGAIEPKKNLRRLIDAFLETDAPTPLAIVGGRGWMWERVIGNIDSVLGKAARERLRFLGYVPREDLRRLHAGAQMFLFPSIYEGFGLPVLDAMRAGVPVLASTGGSLPEICGEAAVLADPFDGASIRAGIERLMSDSDLRSRLAALGRTRAGKFSFASYVERLGCAYSRLG